MRRLIRNALVSMAMVVGMLEMATLAADSPAFTLSSDAFVDGKTIPAEYSCDGSNRSPALHWDGAPEGTKAFVLIVEDPDAPGGTFVHWVLYNVPPATKALGEGMTTTAKLGDGSMQGTNDFGKTGYAGPCPPRGGEHRYVFELYALSEPLDLQPGAKREAVVDAIGGKLLGKAKLTGRYARSSSQSG